MGNSIHGGELEIGVEQLGEPLLVEICDRSHEVIGSASISLNDLWQVSWLLIY